MFYTILFKYFNHANINWLKGRFCFVVSIKLEMFIKILNFKLLDWQESNLGFLV